MQDLMKRLIECKNQIVYLMRKVDDDIAKELEDVIREVEIVIDKLWMKGKGGDTV